MGLVRLSAFGAARLSSGAGGALLAEDGGYLLLENGSELLLEGPGTVAAGSGSASVGPSAAGEVWQAGFRVTVHCSTNTAEAVCRVYCGADTSPANFCDGTTWGSTGDSSDLMPQLSVGQVVTAVWEGGDPGAEAYLVVTGMRMI